MSEYKKIAKIDGSDYYYNGKEFAKEVEYKHLVNVQDKKVLKVLSRLEKVINKEVYENGRNR